MLKALLAMLVIAVASACRGTPYDATLISKNGVQASLEDIKVYLHRSGVCVEMKIGPSGDLGMSFGFDECNTKFQTSNIQCKGKFNFPNVEFEPKPKIANAFWDHFNLLGGKQKLMFLEAETNSTD